ncbi:MAG: BMP family ABC transporter substrate-binding protein, partial [Firmicutes bacterium]|nr:BMP family ABC transporter substrate-binding protein [Bacillota bacterium]
MKKSISLILVLAAIVGCLSFVSYRSKSFASDLKVAILTADVFDDNYTGQTIKDASQQLKSQGITADLIECKGENFRQRLTEAASSHEMVVCVGKQFWEIGEVSGDFPSVQFVWMDNTVEVPEDYPNLENVTFNENQGSYLAGYVAAAMTESGVIGIIAPDKSSSFVRYAAGFIQGAKSANSSVDVVSALAGTGNRDSAYKAAM